ncbi:GNAT family N-acetyltransferase [Paucibacter sp. DJ2R-2]|uniref:GNAT family N-acetyltransferase n=1 Tax=Paucibacter sp. DJ2R-2 TaxID=2893558 RepID=UPI0021E3D481|nr:GNAT family N-acetyltransferase [Paucibacter sp. DJ2R-2]MCV2421556.1 GNAT family N-acetyltransferase [Paucibacter sp. DJ4R-1]MCV2438261.1 GNAT family N-acetyltransferase [Paucibacter sp. DJ2R-2]
MISIHPIRPEDLADVAALHRESWRSAYRGIFSDAFLDSERVVETRLALWTRRLISEPSPGSFGYIARDPSGEALGFTFAFPAFDAQWGSLLDNLHVRPDQKGRGIGRQLLLALSERCAGEWAELGLYLWVFEANTAARGLRASGRTAGRAGGDHAAGWQRGGGVALCVAIAGRTAAGAEARGLATNKKAPGVHGRALFGLNLHGAQTPLIEACLLPTGSGPVSITPYAVHHCKRSPHPW